jgi:deoxyribonuclease I
MKFWRLFFLCSALSACATSQPISVVTTSSTPPVEMAARTAKLSWAYLNALSWPKPQTTYKGYTSTVQRAMWTSVYSAGGAEMYCRDPFTAAQAKTKAIGANKLSWEHAYPADSAAEFFGFSTRDCTTGNSPARNQVMCRAATGDMRNLWPAYLVLNESHGKLPYGEIAGEGTTDPKYQGLCKDFERGNGLVEPTNDAQGDLARTILYMHYVYGLPFDGVIDQRDRLIEWANADPVSQEEAARERAIEAKEPGSWNPLVAAGP